MGLLLIRCSGQGPHLAMTGEPRGFSRVAAGFSFQGWKYSPREFLLLKNVPVKLGAEQGYALAPGYQYHAFGAEGEVAAHFVSGNNG